MLRKPEQLKLVDYKIFQTIGFGSTGRIKIAFDLKNEKYVAIKYMSKYKLMIAKHVDHTYNELKMGYNLRHPFICESMGLIQDHKYLMLVMEFL
jgi:protein kinase A